METITLSGTLLHKLDVKSGVSKVGKEWVRTEFVIEDRSGQYPRKVCIGLFGADKVALMDSVQEGALLKCCVNIESREWQGKWFTNVEAWSLEVVSAATSDRDPSAYQGQAKEQEQRDKFLDGAPTSVDGGADDLPF